jgi:phosphoribosylamine--glycine ligase
MLLFYPQGGNLLKVLVIGGGGREHAIAWRLAGSPSVRQVFISPGNPGCATVGQCVPTPTPGGYLSLAETLGADLTVVGPEAPLVDGVVDQFEAAGRHIFGPTRAAAQLEGSKAFAKGIMQRAGVPTAAYRVAESPAQAHAALEEFRFPVVLKADGLAAGKGVVISPGRSHAEATLKAMFSGALVGAAGSRVVLEEFLTGEEVSFIALCDGDTILPLEPSQDHKAVFDGDQGPNTGGMGAYSDSRILNAAQRRAVVETILRPTVEQLRLEGAPFRGFLYAGLMLTAAGPTVLEYNVRLGDPETQCLLHRLDSDLGALLYSAAAGRLDSRHLSFRPDPSLCLVLAAHGYPAEVRRGDVISGIAAAEATGAVVFHAGTRLGPQGLETAGGRVLGVTAAGATLAGAIDAAYAAAAEIHFDGMHYRRDIGRRGLSRYN